MRDCAVFAVPALLVPPVALAAADKGATVAVLQKEEVALAQGMLCACVVKEESAEVGIAEYVHEMHSIYGHRPDLVLQREYAEMSGEAADWYVGKLDQIGYTDFAESDSKNHEYDGGNCQVRDWLFTGGMMNPTQALAGAAEQFGVGVYYSTPGVQLVVEGGAVRGVVGQVAAGNCSGPFYSDVDCSLSTMGLSVGRCVTFGYITGSYVAGL